MNIDGNASLRVDFRGGLPPPPAKWKAKKFWKRSRENMFGFCTNCDSALDTKALVIPKDKPYLMCRPNPVTLNP